MSNFFNTYKTKTGYFYAVTCVLTWSFIPVVSRYGQQTLNSYQLLFWSNIISLICVGLIFYFFRNRKYPPLTKSLYFYNLFLGSLGCALYYLFLYYGYSRGNNIEVLIIQYSWPLQMIILGYFLLKEKINLLRFLALIFGFLGIIIIITKGSTDNINFSGFHISFTVLIGAFCFALFSILSKRSNVEPLYFAFIIFFGGAITSSLALFLFSNFEVPTQNEIFPIILNGIFINGVSYIFWSRALKLISITNASGFVFLTPIISLIWIIMFFDEHFYLSYIYGGTLVLISSLYCLMEKGN